MTDEEMAEEYENVQDYCGLLDVLFEEQGNQDYGGLSNYISPYIEQAFLAGLKAGKDMNVPIKWHILAEDPTLPKEGQRVRVLTEEGVIEESTLFYDTYFEELTWSNIGLLKVLGWKEIEIPKE